MVRLKLLEIKPRDKNSKEIVPLVTTYNPSLPNIKEIVTKHWDNLECSERMRSALKSAKPLISYRRCKNLKDILCRADVANNEQHKNKEYQHYGQTTIPFGIRPTLGNSKCHRHRCHNCKYMKHTNAVTSRITHSKHYIKQTINCNSKGVIYLIECSLCCAQYVGQTSRTLKTRISEHRSAISLKKPTSVSTHFNSPNHSLKNFTVCGLEKVTDTSRLLERESFWIYTLRTAKPLGLNAMDNLISINEWN